MDNQKAIEELAYFIKKEKVSKKVAKYLMEFGVCHGEKSDAICHQANIFFDAKCAEEFNAFPGGIFNPDKICNWMELFDVPEDAPQNIPHDNNAGQSGNRSYAKCNFEFHDCLIKHPNANLVIWPDWRLIDFLEFPPEVGKKYYDQFAQICTQFKIFAESEETFTERYSGYGFTMACFLKKPANKCECYSHIKFVIVPAVHLITIAKSRSFIDPPIDFEKLSLIGQ